MKAQRFFLITLLFSMSISVFSLTHYNDVIDLDGRAWREGKNNMPDVSASTDGNLFSVSGNKNYSTSSKGNSTPVEATYDEICITIYSETTGEMVYQTITLIKSGDTITFALPGDLEEGDYKVEIIYDDWLFEGVFTI